MTPRGLGPAIQGLRVELLSDCGQEGARCQRTAGGGIKDAQNLSENRLRLCRLHNGDTAEPVHLRRIHISGRLVLFWTEALRRIHPLPHLTPRDELFTAVCMPEPHRRSIATSTARAHLDWPPAATAKGRRVRDRAQDRCPAADAHAQELPATPIFRMTGGRHQVGGVITAPEPYQSTDDDLIEVRGRTGIRTIASALTGWI